MHDFVAGLFDNDANSVPYELEDLAVWKIVLKLIPLKLTRSGAPQSSILLANPRQDVMYSEIPSLQKTKHVWVGKITLRY
jgi:hypothetical protein